MKARRLVGPARWEWKLPRPSSVGRHQSGDARRVRTKFGRRMTAPGKGQARRVFVTPLSDGRRPSSWHSDQSDFWCGKLSVCPNEMVPLQTDRAIGLGRYLFSCLPNPRRARHPAFWGSHRSISSLLSRGELIGFRARGACRPVGPAGRSRLGFWVRVVTSPKRRCSGSSRPRRRQSRPDVSCPGPLLTGRWAVGSRRRDDARRCR
jgi:hypothetical protein